MSEATMSYREIVAAAEAAEKKAQWTEAARLWDQAREEARKKKRSTGEAVTRAMAARQRVGETAPDVPVEKKAEAPAEAVAAEPVESKKAERRKRGEKRAEAISDRETRRAKENGLEPGAVLRHTRQGEPVCEVRWVSPGRWIHDGVEHASLNKAKEAAMRKLGMKPGKDGKFDSVSAWTFWGVEKREEAK